MVTTGIRLWIFFDTQTIYLFFSSFFLDVNVVTSCESCGRKAAMCCLHQRQKFARGRLAWSRSKENTHTQKNTHKKVLHNQPLPKNKQNRKKKLESNAGSRCVRMTNRDILKSWIFNGNLRRYAYVFSALTSDLIPKMSILLNNCQKPTQSCVRISSFTDTCSDKCHIAIAKEHNIKADKRAKI